MPRSAGMGQISSLRMSSSMLTSLKVTTRRSEEHTPELQSRQYLVCRLLLEKIDGHVPQFFRHAALDHAVTVGHLVHERAHLLLIVVHLSRLSGAAAHPLLLSRHPVDFVVT